MARIESVSISKASRPVQILNSARGHGRRPSRTILWNSTPAEFYYFHLFCRVAYNA